MSVLQRETHANDAVPIYANIDNNVSLLVAGPGIILSPPEGQGVVTLTAYGGGAATDVDFTNNVTPIKAPFYGVVPTDLSGSQIPIMRCEADGPAPQNNRFDMTLGSAGVKMSSVLDGFTGWGFEIGAAPVVLKASNNWDTGVQIVNEPQAVQVTLVPTPGKILTCFDGSANPYPVQLVPTLYTTSSNSTSISTSNVSLVAPTLIQSATATLSNWTIEQDCVMHTQFQGVAEMLTTGGNDLLDFELQYNVNGGSNVSFDCGHLNTYVDNINKPTGFAFSVEQVIPSLPIGASVGVDLLAYSSLTGDNYSFSGGPMLLSFRPGEQA